MQTTDENELVRRAQGGDAEAYGTIYDLYAPKLYRFIYYKVHHRETAQDLLSETFMKSLKAIGRFDPERGTVSSWLYSIARNAVIDHYRTVRPESDLEDAWGLDSGSDVARDAETALKLEAVRGHLAALSAMEREILTMRVWGEMSHAEIAAALGKTEDACKVAFSRAVAKLKKAMPLATFILFLTQKI